MINLNQIKKDSNFRALFIGPSGMGKTLSAASWPGKTLIFDFDNRYMPILSWYPERVKAGEFEIFQVNAKNLLQGPNNFKDEVDKLLNSNPYANIILDGITTMTNTALNMQMVAKGKDTIGGQFIFDKDNKLVVPTWPEFSGLAMIVSSFLEIIKGFNCNFFVTAHPVMRSDMKTGRKYETIVYAGPKGESIIPNYFDDVYDFDIEAAGISAGQGSRRIVTTEMGPNSPLSKTAIKGLPAKIDITAPKQPTLYEQVKKYLV